MTPLLSLAKRLEQATEGSRELDLDIAKAVGWTNINSTNLIGTPPGARNCWEPIPHYTTSIDSAVSLTPAGWMWKIEFIVPYISHAIVKYTTGSVMDWMAVEGKAVTPALALSSAAIRALAASKGRK